EGDTLRHLGDAGRAGSAARYGTPALPRSSPRIRRSVASRRRTWRCFGGRRWSPVGWPRLSKDGGHATGPAGDCHARGGHPSTVGGGSSGLGTVGGDGRRLDGTCDWGR